MDSAVRKVLFCVRFRLWDPESDLSYTKKYKKIRGLRPD